MSVLITDQLRAEWDSSKNGPFTDQIPAASTKLYWWICQKVPEHRWKASMYDRIGKDLNCPKCKPGTAHKLSKERFSNVYASLSETHPQLVPYWDAVKNKHCLNSISLGSQKLVWWKCPNGHQWQIIVADQVRKKHPCTQCAKLELANCKGSSQKSSNNLSTSNDGQ